MNFSLRKLAISIAFIVPVMTATLPVAHAATDFQSVLNEERTWAGFTSKRVTAGDVDWAYSEGGDPSKPTILLVHGLGGSRDNWNRVAHHLTPYYHVVAVDLPASGETKIAATYDLQPATMTESLRRFVETIHIEKNLNIAGHSMGGTIAGLYASLYFSDTQSLLLVDTAGVYATTKSPYLKDPSLLRNFVVRKPGDLKNVIKIAMQDAPFIPKDIFDGQEKVMIGQAPTMTILVEKLIELNKSYTPDSFATVVKSIEAPTLVIWGKQDQIVDVGVVPELMSSLKDKRPPVILDNVGHTPILEAEQLVVQAYLPFLTKAIATPNKFAAVPAPAAK